ncbi:Glucan endo-1,3-beta-glucosidase [Capsicum annuum]|nr:Glucan endo-1,3-beta-glucosidase [Capsicum annuum]
MPLLKSGDGSLQKSRVQALKTVYDRNARCRLCTTCSNRIPAKSWPVCFHPIPTGWSGRLWGRTFCSQDSSTGKFACATGDCSSGTLECSGTGAAPPVTVAEFTLNGAGGLDFYDVSLVHGYNLPILVSPQGGTGVGGVGNCSTTGCVGDLNEACPKELKKMMDSHSSNNSSNSECVGSYATPDTCKPTDYSEFFKNACPKSYSYAYDDGTSTFTCSSADYVISFCPASSDSPKSSGGLDTGVDAGLLRSVLTNMPLPFLISLIITVLAAV